MLVCILISVIYFAHWGDESSHFPFHVICLSSHFSLNSPNSYFTIRMKNKPAFPPKGRRPCGSPLGTSASQFGMTPQETNLVNNIIQHKDFSMESLKHPKIQQIIKQRKGRWVQVSWYIVLNLILIL